MIKNTNPVKFCENLAVKHVKVTKDKDRKKQGQFFTPPELARFMADLGDYETDILRILDPGAGTGILSCAVCEKAASIGIVRKIIIDAYENDPKLINVLKESFNFTKGWLSKHKIELDYNIIGQDFILTVPQGLWSHAIKPYDIVISNPPYFKITNDDPRAVAAKHLVYGQPNIYALFMGVAAETLKSGGLLIFITSRSYTSGPYFKQFRENFFKIVTPNRVHVFKSRKDTFKKDDVQQENIILKAKRDKKVGTITVSVSQNTKDLNTATSYTLDIDTVLHRSKKDIILRIPASDLDLETIATVEGWQEHLNDFNMQISTGPVVPFRATDLLTDVSKPEERTVPLIWMNHFQSMNLSWPSTKSINENGNGKPQHIRINEKALKKKLLVSDQNMVLLRRFSAKEEKRRLIAAPLFKNFLNSELIGLENHVNYIYRKDGKMTKHEANGIAALLNSSLYDRYFRISNGNTQVSATEVRTFPLPPLATIRNIGRRISRIKRVPSYEEIEDILRDSIR